MSYGSMLGQMATPVGLGSPPADALLPPGKTVVDEAPLRKTTDQAKYHKQRNDALAALHHAWEKHGNLFSNPAASDENVIDKAQDVEARKAFNTLFSIYDKIPGGTNVGKVGKSNAGPLWQDIDKVTSPFNEEGE